MRIKITADSTVDLTPEYLAEQDVELFPLSVIKDGAAYKDGVEITPDEIFAHVEAGGAICSTSCVSVGDYQKRFEALSKEYDAVIHIALSSDFSAGFQNARLAAAELPNVYPIDSRNLSTGSGHLVYQAAKMRDKGMDAADIVKELEALTGKIETSFILDTLEYLRKGGRCSTLAALGANLLSLHPCIEVVDGKMRVGKKYRGPRERVLLNYVKDRLSGRDDIRYDHIYITHSGLDEEMLQKIRAAVEEYGNFEVIDRTRAGCTISNHCGPKCMGILFIRK